jgi:hypothetical protein
MIKFVQCVRRKTGLSKQEFAEYFTEYGKQVKSIADASNSTRCVLSRSLAVERNLEIMQERGTKAPYDGMVEVWWDRGNDIVAFLDSGSGDKVIDELRKSQEVFMDLPNCTFFFASEDE